MIFHSQNLTPAVGRFTFAGEVCATAHSCLCKPIFKELWQSFCYDCSTLSPTKSDDLVFSIGGVSAPAPEDCACVIAIEREGVCIRADSEQELIRGLMTFFDRIKAVDLDGETVLSADCCLIRERPLMQCRMVHFCVFPETELWELHRFVRFCAALKYTHLVLEFWGMLRYDCMAELAWSHAFTKEQLRPILREANELGLEIVPMFNHWGHASAGRVLHGKHVVLDQNPALQTYFSEDGWCWDIQNPKVRGLLRSIRRELCELCGAGKYFHVGCDEAYQFELNRGNMDLLCSFLSEIANDLAATGRRAIAWGDMFLYRHGHYDPNTRYSCNAPTAEVETYLLSHLDHRIVIADWQYNATVIPVETAAVFTRAGFDCLLCPWDRGAAQTCACVATAKEQGLMGLMHTTWHTLSKGMPYVTLMAVGCFEDIAGKGHSDYRTATAALLRRVYPVHGDYEKAGWAKHQIAVIT